MRDNLVGSSLAKELSNYNVMDAPYESSGPSLEEGRKIYINALMGSKKYSIEIVEKYVDQFIDEEYDKRDRYPMGSDRGFWMCFDIHLEEIEKLLLRV